MNKETKDNADVIRIKELNLDIIAPSTATYRDPEQGGTKTVICGKPGCFSLGTPVLMADGSIKTVEDVCVGENVMGPDSCPRKVLELCRNNDRMYKILGVDGESYTVNEQHKLVLKSKISSEIVEITVENFLKKTYNERKSWSIFRAEVDFPSKPVPVDSYMLGFLIDFSYTGLESPSSENELIRYIHENRLLSNKRIPEEYKRNSREVRLDILAGIVDLSATYDEKRNEYFLKMSEKTFSDDIVYVSRSLGFSARRKDGCIYIGGNICNIPCRLDKKAIKTDIDCKASDFDVIPQGFGDYYGFTIDGDHRFLLGSFDVVRNTGKCLAPGTPVMMFDGKIKKVEEIKVGDLLMGDDSTHRTVLSTCNGVDEMYEIVQRNGDNYRVNSPHILSLKCNSNFRNYKKGEIIDIPVNEFINKTNSFRNLYCGYKVGVDFPSKKVELDPYLLGYWIGDGTSEYPAITTTDDEVLDYFEKKLFELGLYLKQKPQDPITYRIIQIDGPKHFQNHFRNFLRNNNLIKNKHIPDDYKMNDRKVRLEILAGVLDADAWYDQKGNCYDFVQKNEKVIDDVIYISRSLGFSANKKECYKSCTYKGEIKRGKYFRCHISGDVDEIPTQILRKKARPRKSNKNHLSTKISVKYVGEGEYYGFQLDGNHRFLLGDFTVTHNTTLIASLLYAKKHIFPVGMAMSGTEDSNHFYRSVMPSTFVFNNYDEPQIENFIRRQKIAKEHLENPWAVMILDDCTDDPALFRKPLQNGLYKRGRHWKMWYILSLQYGMDVRPVIRTNVDGVFILREPNLRNRRVMYENYAAIIPDFKLFCDILDQITNDYTALYIHNATKTNDWRDCVFWYKAKPVPKDFKFGSDSYWDFHFQRYNDSYVDPVTV